jgi:lipopolysaccharide export system permease protein
MAELMRVFTLLAVVLTVMLVFVGVFREATERGLGAVQILQIMPYIVPSMLPFTIPATLLLSVCVIYGRISGDLEVVAAKAAGISAMQMLAPAFLLGFLLSVGSYGLTNYAIPWAMVNIERIVSEGMEDIFLEMLASQNLISQPERGFSINVREVRNRTLIDATFKKRAKNHQQITVRAAKAQIRFDLERQQMRLILMDVEGSVPGSDRSGGGDRQEIAFPLPQAIGRVKARHLTAGQLREGNRAAIADEALSRQQQLQHAAMLLMTGDFGQLGADSSSDENSDVSLSDYQLRHSTAIHNHHRFTTEIHSRMAMAASCFFFTLVGGPFSMLQARRQFITSFIMCFLPILIIYYPVMFLMLNLCKSGTLDPSWAMWTPNLILTLASLFALRKIIQH